MDADSDIYIRPPTFRVYLCIMALCTGRPYKCYNCLSRQVRHCR